MWSEQTGSRGFVACEERSGWGRHGRVGRVQEEKANGELFRGVRVVAVVPWWGMAMLGSLSAVFAGAAEVDEAEEAPAVPGQWG